MLRSKFETQRARRAGNQWHLRHRSPGRMRTVTPQRLYATELNQLIIEGQEMSNPADDRCNSSDPWYFVESHTSIIKLPPGGQFRLNVDPTH